MLALTTFPVQLFLIIWLPEHSIRAPIFLKCGHKRWKLAVHWVLHWLLHICSLCLQTKAAKGRSTIVLLQCELSASSVWRYGQCRSNWSMLAHWASWYICIFTSSVHFIVSSSSVYVISFSLCGKMQCRLSSFEVSGAASIIIMSGQKLNYG